MVAPNETVSITPYGESKLMNEINNITKNEPMLAGRAILKFLLNLFVVMLSTIYEIDE